jgi:hypothetical protein
MSGSQISDDLFYNSYHQSPLTKIEAMQDRLVHLLSSPERIIVIKTAKGEIRINQTTLSGEDSAKQAVLYMVSARNDEL